MTLRRLQTLPFLAAITVFQLGCPEENPPPAEDAGIAQDGGLPPNPELVVDPDPSTLSLVEGEGPVTFTVKLTEDPQRAIAATISSTDPSVVTVAPDSAALDSSSWESGVTVTLTPQDDDDTTNDTADITVDTDLGIMSFTVTVVDDDAANVVAMPLALSVGEGRTATVGVRLSAAPETALTIDVRSSDEARVTADVTSVTFDATTWDTPRAVTISALDDVDLAENQVSVDFQNPVNEGATVEVTVTDDDEQAYVISTSSITIDETGSATFDVSLAYQPDADVTVSVTSNDPNTATVDTATLTFTPADYDAPRPLTASGVPDPNVVTNTATITIASNDVPIRGSVVVTVLDDDTQIIEVDTATVTVNENGSASFAVRLGFMPGNDVTVSVVSSNVSLVGASPTQLTFTPADWDQYQMVTVGGLDDLNVANESEIVTLSAPGAGDVAVGVTVLDDDTQAIMADAASLSVMEGGSVTIGVRLAYQPTGDTVVGAVSAAGTFTAAPAMLTFTPADYDSIQLVTISGSQDLNVTDETDSLDLSAAGVAPLSVPVSVLDDDIQSIVVSANSITAPENGSATFDVSLAFQPAAGVTVTLTAADPFISANPGALTFNSGDWNMARTITVAAMDDANTTDEQSSITLASTGLMPVSVQVDVTDDDQQAILLDTNTLSISEGGSATFNARLAYQPSSPVTLSISSSDPTAASAVPVTLMFDAGDYDQLKTVTIGGVDDVDVADENVTITVDATGLTAETIAVTVTDDDTQAIVADQTTASLSEGASTTVGVNLAYQPSGTVSVSVASGDPAVTATPAMLSFGPGNYDTPQPITLTAVQDVNLVNESVTVTLTSAALTPVAITVSVTDDDTQALVVTPAALSVGEAGSDDISVSLAFMPATDVTVTITSQDTNAATPAIGSLTFTPGNYAMVQTVAINGVQDADVQDETTQVTVASAGLTSVNVDVTVVDDDILNLNVAPTSLALNEGGAAGSFDVSLTQQPSGPTTVTVTPSQAGGVSLGTTSLTFTTTDWNMPQSISVTPIDDDDALDESLTLTVSSGMLTPRTVAVTVADDDTQAIVVDTNSLSLGEGANGTVMVRLAFDPVTPATVNVASGDAGAVGVNASSLTFTSADYDQPQAVTISAVDDADTRDENVNVTLSSAVAGTDEIVTVTVTDDDTQALVLTTNTVAIGEGATQVVGVSLAFDPVNPVTVTAASSDSGAVGAAPTTFTFDSGNYANPQNLTVSGVQDDDTVDETETITVTTPVAATETVDVSVTDDDTQAIQVSANTVNVGEGATTTFTVRLAFNPINQASVSLVSSDPAVADAAPTPLLFDANSWSVPQTVTVTAPQDDDTQDGSATITLSSAVAANVTVDVSVADDDTQAILLSDSTLLVQEDSNDQFTVRLAFNPLGPVTVSVANPDPAALDATPLSLSFDANDYDQPQPVTVAGVDDADTLDESVTLTVSGGGAPASETVVVTVNDNDTQALVLSQQTVTVTEGGSDTSVTVALAFDPVNPAVVNVVSNDGGAASGAPAQLTFTSADYDQPQTLTIDGVQDQDLADESVTITLVTAVANDETIDVTVTDDDTQTLVVVPQSLSIQEGSTATFDVSLMFIPGGNVTVDLASADTNVATLSDASLTFSPGTYNVAQAVTVTAEQDVDLVDGATTIDVTSMGVAPVTVNVAVTDDDTQAFVINPGTVSVSEGGNAGTFDVSLQFQPTGPVTVSLSSSDPNAVSVSPASLNFDAGNFSNPQPVMVSGVTDADTRDETETVMVASAAVPSPGSVTVNVTDDDVQALAVIPGTLTVTEEGAFATFTVAFDYEPDGPTVVDVTSTDPGAVSVSPAQLTFTPSDYGAQAVTVVGVSDPDVVSEMVNVDVTTAIAPAELVVVTVTDDDTQAIQPPLNNITVTEDTGPGTFTVRLAFMPQNDTTVSIVSSDMTAATTTPTSLLFTPGNYDQPQTVTVNGTTDPDQVDETAVLTLSAGGGIQDQTVDVNVTDDDDQAIILSANTVNVDEESTTTFTVALAFQPLGQTETVTFTSQDPGAATTDPVMVVFDGTNYSTPVTVTVDGVTDEDILDETVTVDVTSDAGGTPAEVLTVNVNDIDIQDIILSRAMVALTEGGTSTVVTVRLAQDPSGPQVVNVASLDANAVSALPATLTFDSGDYTQPQPVTLAPVDDDDVRDETVDVELTTANVIGPRITTVTVADDDTQVIVTAASLTVTEGSSGTLDVRLGFRPTNPVTVTLTLGDPAVASLSTSQLTFDDTDFDQDQSVTVTGTQDNDLDDEATTITLSTGGLAPPEGALDQVVTLDITDDDQQVIITDSIPATLPTSVQEGGPSVAFEVSLGYPPLLADGGQDVVEISSTLPNLTFTSSVITFDRMNFDVPVQVTVTAADDTNTTSELNDVDLQIVGEVSATHQVQVIDDEETILATTTYPNLTGGTLFTKRQNVRWGATRLGVVGFDTTTGDTMIGSNTRELDDSVVGPAVASGGGGALSAEAVEFDGTDFGFFVTSSNGIEFVRSDETANATLLNQNIAGSNTLNFWPAWNGTDAYGLVYRQSGVASDPLRFVTVQLDGTTSSPMTLTISDGSDDVQPNAHFVGTGYTVLYSSSTEVRCVRTDASGALIPNSDTALAGFPVGGAYVSSVYDGTDIVAAYYNATNSINVVRVDPSNCTVVGSHQAVGGSNVFLSTPPSIGWNGTEFAVAYDFLNGGVETVGVLLVTPGLGYRDDYVVGTGSKPSISWAGDRWALRYGDPVEVVVGSFQTLCADGIQNGQELGVDCGGPTCQPCP